MSTERKLEEIATQLDDMSVTLEEVKDQVRESDAVTPKHLTDIQEKIEKATDVIEEVVDPERPE